MYVRLLFFRKIAGWGGCKIEIAVCEGGIRVSLYIHVSGGGGVSTCPPLKNTLYVHTPEYNFSLIC